MAAILSNGKAAPGRKRLWNQHLTQLRESFGKRQSHCILADKGSEFLSAHANLCVTDDGMQLGRSDRDEHGASVALGLGDWSSFSGFVFDGSDNRCFSHFVLFSF